MRVALKSNPKYFKIHFDDSILTFSQAFLISSIPISPPRPSRPPRPSTEHESEAEYDSDESEESEDSDYYSEEYSGSEEV